MKSFKEIINGDTKLAEFLRFAMVGGVATVLQYGIYVVFVHAVFNGGKAVVASLISYAISFVANFLLSNYFTFHKHPNAKRGIGFTLSHLINMGMQTGLVAIFKGIVGPTLALLPAIGICVPINYFLVRFALTSNLTKSGKEKREEAILEALEEE